MTTDITDWDLSGENKTAYEMFREGISHLKKKDDYESKLNQFLGHIEKDADFLAELGRDAISDSTKTVHFQNLLNQASNEMMLGHSYKMNSMKYLQRVLRKFFDTLGIPFKFTFRADNEIRQANPELFETNSAQPMRKEEMRAIITRLGNSRNIAMSFFSRDTGLRLDDCTNMKIKQIQPILGDNPPKFHVFEELYTPLKNIAQSETKQSSPLPATLIMGYESILYVRAWMKERETLLRKNNVDPYDPEGWVFCMMQNMKDARVGDQVSIETVSNSIGYIRNKLKLRKGLSFHSFRNNHTTDLLSGGVPELFVLVLQGKTGNSGSIRDYTNPDKNKLLDFYKRAYSTLALESKESEVISNLTEQVKLQQERIEELEKTVDVFKSINIGQIYENGESIITMDFPKNGITQINKTLNKMESQQASSVSDKEIQEMKEQLNKMMRKVEAFSKRK